MEQQPPINGPQFSPAQERAIAPNVAPSPGNVPEIAAQPVAPEQSPAPQEAPMQAHGVGAAAPQASASASSAPPVVPQVVPADQSADDDTTSPLDADDIDVIEKAWVDRAKVIVMKTKADPYEQKKQTSILQSDYMKKRYNKDVQLVDN